MSDIEGGVHFRADPEGHDDAVWHRIAFRFLFAYFVLYALPTPTTISLIKSIPGITFLRDGYLNLCQAVLPWVATRVLHVSGPDSTRYLSAGGDSILHYVYWFCIVALATLATIIWSILDRKRSDYHVLHIWLRVLLRYTLAFALFWYGFRKVFPLQFQPVDLARMIRPISEITPRGLMWGFMGTSPPYVVFTGLVELLGGALLLFRRTTTLGAMISLAAMANVVMLNLCYDVQAKLPAINLLLMAVVLLAPNMRYLLNVLVLHRESAERFDGGYMQTRHAGTVLWVLLVGSNLYGNISQDWAEYKSVYVSPKRPPLYGLYEVQTFVRNGAEVPPLTTDSTRWRKVAIEYPTNLQIRMMDDAMKYYPVEYNTSASTVTFNNKDVFSYSMPSPDLVVLDGRFGGDALNRSSRRVQTVFC